MESRLNSIWDPVSKVYWSDGYYARRILAGDRPDYKLPNTGLPVPAINEMEIKTRYIEALKKNKVA